MKRKRSYARQLERRPACFCTGDGPHKEKRQCHLCKNKNLNNGFKEIAGHVYCPACLNTDGKGLSNG
jgi:hypothetical protein